MTSLCVSVIDACFPLNHQTNAGMGAKYLIWDLARYGVTPVQPQEADIILVSMVSPLLIRKLTAIRRTFRDAKIIVGGACSTSPAAIGPHCDAVCVGDGQRFVRVLCSEGLSAALQLENIWVRGEDRRVSVDSSFPYDMPPIQYEDGAYRIWCGRGCKNKCLFCQTGWAYKYSENPNLQLILSQIELLKARGAEFAYLSNDLMQHSFCNQLPSTNSGSYSLNYIRKCGLPPARQVRLGIEGVSERLRALVSKPISSDDLVRSATWLMQHGKSVRWFLIAGLPGETSEDWDQLKADIQKWKQLCQKGCLGLSFTAWCPDPATPICAAPINDDYWPRYERFREWFFGGQGWSNRIKLYGPQKPASRMEKAKLSMCLTEAQLREGGQRGPNSRISYPYKESCARIAARNFRY